MLSISYPHFLQNCIGFQLPILTLLDLELSRQETFYIITHFFGRSG